MSLLPGFTIEAGKRYSSTKRLLHSTSCPEALNITRPCDMLPMAVANNVLRRPPNRRKRTVAPKAAKRQTKPAATRTSQPAGSAARSDRIRSIRVLDAGAQVYAVTISLRLTPGCAWGWVRPRKGFPGIGCPGGAPATAGSWAGTCRWPS
jgi:hypothetical protein